MGASFAVRPGETGRDSDAAAAEERIPECGIASLYCALQMLGRNVPLHDVTARVENLTTGGDGSQLSMKQLREVVESYGLYAASVRARPETIHSLHVPAILFLAPPDWRDRGDVGHFIVLEKVDAAGAHVVDVSFPRSIPTGRTVIKLTDLPKVWAGEALLVDTRPIQMRTASRLAPISTFVLAGILLGLIATIFLRGTRASDTVRSDAPDS
jgi:ABC-type bacteriocin/lantibiotic exporter with double-glycine peptidase domain